MGICLQWGLILLLGHYLKVFSLFSYLFFNIDIGIQNFWIPYLILFLTAFFVNWRCFGFLFCYLGIIMGIGIFDIFFILDFWRVNWEIGDVLFFYLLFRYLLLFVLGIEIYLILKSCFNDLFRLVVLKYFEEIFHLDVVLNPVKF